MMLGYEVVTKFDSFKKVHNAIVWYYSRQSRNFSTIVKYLKRINQVKNKELRDGHFAAMSRVFYNRGAIIEIFPCTQCQKLRGINGSEIFQAVRVKRWRWVFSTTITMTIMINQSWILFKLFFLVSKNGFKNEIWQAVFCIVLFILF